MQSCKKPYETVPGQARPRFVDPLGNLCQPKADLSEVCGWVEVALTLASLLAVPAITRNRNARVASKSSVHPGGLGAPPPSPLSAVYARCRKANLEWGMICGVFTIPQGYKFLLNFTFEIHTRHPSNSSLPQLPASFGLLLGSSLFLRCSCSILPSLRCTAERQVLSVSPGKTWRRGALGPVQPILLLAIFRSRKLPFPFTPLTTAPIYTLTASKISTIHRAHHLKVHLSPQLLQLRYAQVASLSTLFFCTINWRCIASNAFTQTLPCTSAQRLFAFGLS